MYKCIKSFSLPKCDEDGFETDEYLVIEKGSVWNLLDTNFRIIGGEMRLENPETLEWLEMSNESLSEYFEPLEGENNG